MKVVEMRAVLVAAVVALAGTAGAAQPQGALHRTGGVATLNAGPTDWGAASNIITTIDASDFEIFSGSAGGTDPNTAAKFCGGGGCGWLAGLSLPSGARLISLELDACDNSGEEVAVGLFKSTKGGATVTSLAAGGTGTAGQPGCSTFALTLPTPETINNLSTNYLLDVTSGATNTTSFRAVRAIYRLQVSPAPAVASFPNDVPTTHGFFRFVEAMAASGLTGGCATGSFCPDAPVTRGQLSVFLAVALGLHFPN